jgi:uncharacterized heparinase superfamily protein
VVNGLLTRPKERRSFKPKVESSILSGRIPLYAGLCSFVLQTAIFQDFGQSGDSAACRHAPMPAAG